MQNITSRFLSINTQDTIKGGIVSVGAAVFTLIAQSVDAGKFTFDFTAIWHTAVAAGFAYIGKQFFTPAKVVTPAQ